MTPDHEAKFADLMIKSKLAADKLQRIVDALAEAAFYQHVGIGSSLDQDALVAEYERTLQRIDAIADEQEKLLRDAGLLPRKPA